MANDIDVSRCVIINGLPSAFFKDSADDFAETIYELLETTFSVTRDAVDHLIRSPRLEPNQKGFGCKCLISFRSRVHRHRVIAQKSKIEPPTTIASITEMPRDILESNEEVLEVTDEWAEDNGKQVKEVKGSGSPSKAAPIMPTRLESVTGPVKKIYSSGKPNLDECAENDEEIILVEGDSASSVESSVIAKNSGTSRSIEEGSGILAESQQKDDKYWNEEDDMLELPPLSPIDIHQKEHFSKLRTDWEGAPEFQWRNVSEDEEKQMLRIENIVPSDIYNPWIYPVVLTATRMKIDFPNLAYNEVANFTFGKVDLYFSDVKTLVSCALNYLVYMRTSLGRRAKIFLPHIKSAMKFGKSLEKRLGHLRAPTPAMCQLLVKPIPENITEKEIRKDAFPRQEITKIEFKHDSLKQRCAILTFASAQCAIAAHCTTNYVAFEKTVTVATVLYPIVAVPEWDKGENLLVVAEMKDRDEIPSLNKVNRLEEQKKEVTSTKNQKQTDAPEEKQEVGRKSKEKTAAKEEVKKIEKHERRRSQAGKCASAGPSYKIPRRGSYPHHGSSFVSRSSFSPLNQSSWRSTGNIQPLFPVRPISTFNGPAGPISEYSYNAPCSFRESYREEQFDGNSNICGGGTLDRNSSWRNDFGGLSVPGRNTYRDETYREDTYRSQPDAILEDRIREQREKLAYREQMLRQQKRIDELEKQIRSQTQLTGGYIGSFEERPETTAQTSWNATPGLSTSTYINDRVSQLW